MKIIVRSIFSLMKRFISNREVKYYICVSHCFFVHNENRY